MKLKYILLLIIGCIGIESSNAQTIFGSDKGDGGIVKPGGIISSPTNAICGSFKPIPGKQYIISGWTKERHITPQKSYNIAKIKVVFELVNGNSITTEEKVFGTSGGIIEGWQRIIGEFTVPSNAKSIGVTLFADNTVEAFFDDIRVHPFNGNLKSYVYDYSSSRLTSELDENNYATFYEYDKEGGLVRVKKETAKGVYTLQETRSGNYKRDQ